MESHSIEAVTISIPRERDFAIVAGLVVGGVAARHDVTLDVLEDIQLALDSLLDSDEEADGEVSVVISVGSDAIEVSVGPVGERTVAALESEAGDELGLRRLLDSTVDGVSLSERDGQTWVELRKGYALTGLQG